MKYKQICWKWIPPSLEDLLPTELEPESKSVKEARAMLNPKPRSEVVYEQVSKKK